MSKVDALRALREARFNTRSSAPAAAPARAAVPPARVRTIPDPEPDTQSCGHRSMNGRSCTREQGHAEKNHRYG